MAYNKDSGIDLHIHSTASDGTLAPSEILAQAIDLKISAIAITDHDTLEGSKELHNLNIPSSIKILSGVEISATPLPSFPCSGSFHILGYGINLEDKVLNNTLDVLQEARRNRNPEIVRRLQNLDVDVSMNEIIEIAGGGQVGRPHIAKLMLQKGIVTSINEAFDRYLAKNRPAYVDKYRVECQKAIEIIHGAGGIPVIAHPFLLKLKNNADIENLIVTLKAMGIKGVEVYYPEHPKDVVSYYYDIAKRHDLLITGGTDFHGSLKPEIKMGSGRGDLFVPYELYERLTENL